MEILVLVLLYLLSQNPDFPQRLQPIMKELKNSEELLRFMKDLSSLSEMFGKTKESEQKNEAPPPPPPKEEKKPQSPTRPIADDFIEKCLRDYFKKP